MKQLQNTVIMLAGLAIATATIYVVWQFACLDIPHPAHWISEYMPILGAAGEQPTEAKLGLLVIFAFPLYWISGVGLYLAAGTLALMVLKKGMK